MRHGKYITTYATDNRPEHRRRPGTARPGFSLLEMTVVIGIIMLLMAMAIIGYRYVESKTAADSTRVSLHNAEAMVTELDRMGQGWRLEGTGGRYAAGAAITTNPGDVTRSGTGRAAGNSYGSIALGILLQLQTNQDAYGKLPTKSLVPGSRDPGNPNANPPVPPVPPVLADGWGNPLIWVPSGGLGGVRLRSSTDANGTVSYGVNTTIKSPDRRGFWASAGPDGDFSTGDDNVYSFQK